MPDFYDPINSEAAVGNLSSSPETGTPSSILLTRVEKESSKEFPNSGEAVLSERVPPAPIAVMTRVNWFKPSHPLPNQYSWEKDTVDFHMPSYNMSTSAGGWNSASDFQEVSYPAPGFMLLTNPESNFSYEKSASYFPNSQYLPPRRDREIMHRYLPFHDHPLVTPKFPVSAAYHDEYRDPLFAHDDDLISLSQTCEVEDMSALPNDSGHARSNPPRAILEIFRAEKGWRPAPKVMFTTWRFGAVGERLIPGMLSNP